MGWVACCGPKRDSFVTDPSPKCCNRVLSGNHSDGTLGRMLLRWLIVVVTLGLLAMPPPAAGASRGVRRHFASAFACRSGAAKVDGSLALRLIPAFRLRWSPGGV